MSVLRSWFWNMLLVAAMAVMGFISTSVAVSGIDSGSHITVVIFGGMAIAFWAAVVRGAMLGVIFHPDRIVARGLGRTTVIRWEQMERVEADGLVGGAAAFGRAITPVVYWKRPGDSDIRRTELSMLGGYVFGFRRPTRMERNATEINEQLTRWREQHVRKANGD
ncbi:hypothetical protein [Actinoplanes sp. NPDC049802]|uniref:hypothetical protein n=1 Tax=Actinoplanes sp. NPDC049802 TaxID=3154742 RepID=UPI00340ACE61